MSLTCQSSFGPAAGHCLSRPVSDDTPLRCGPRHWGQSEDELRWAEVLTGTAERHTHSVARVASSRNFKIFSFGWLGLRRFVPAREVTECCQEMFRHFLNRSYRTNRTYPSLPNKRLKNRTIIAHSARKASGAAATALVSDGVSDGVVVKG